MQNPQVIVQDNWKIFCYAKLNVGASLSGSWFGLQSCRYGY